MLVDASAAGAQAAGIACLPKQALGLLGGNPGGSGLSVPVPFGNQICLAEDMVVAGTSHVPNIDRIAERLGAGDELRFERDKGNLHDAWAVKVLAGSERVGFVPCGNNEMIARMMDGGKRVFGKVVAKERRGTWNKIHMEVYLDD